MSRIPGTATEQAIAIAGNVIPSVCLILLNKLLVKEWNYPITLTVMHMIFLSFSMHFASAIGVFESKRIPLKQLAIISLSGVGSIAFMNMSLAWNSVGVYQLSKLACIPVTVLIQTFFFGKHFSTPVNLSLVIVMVGIAGTTVTDLNFNLVGVFWAVLAVLSTTQYQIWIDSKQKEFSLSQFQLLDNVAPGMAFVTLSSLPFFEAWGENAVQYSDFDMRKLIIAFLSCVAAVGVNFSTYHLIRKTSVVTYLVVGHVKTILILSFGFVFFQSAPTLKNALYMCVSLLGVFVYGYLKYREGKKEEEEKKKIEQEKSK